MKQLAVLILTYNEEKNVTDCIKSVLFADEIVIVDSGSTDKTLQLAEKLGARVSVHPMDQGFAGQRNFALTQTDAEWVLFLDADERITPEAAQEIREVINQPAPYAYEILRRNVIFGQPVNHGGHAPDYSLRLYPRSAIHWEGVVHEQALVNLPVRCLKNHMLHYTYTSWEKYFFKFNQFTTLMAEKMYQQGKRANIADFIFRPWFAWLRFYILKSGWKDGKTGFFFAMFHAYYTFTKYVKLYYLEKGGNLR